MADISQIILPDGSSVNIKDATARSDKMDKTNPTGTGELSINRRANSTTGNKSSTLGYNCVASGSYSHAEGQATTASGNYGSHAEGAGSTAAGNYSHAEGQYTAAQGSSSHAEGLSSQTGTNADGAHAEGNTCIANGAASHAEGYITKSPGDYSHSEGRNTEAKGTASHAEGYGTTANHKSQHVFGEYNVLDNSEAAVTEKGNYVEVVGNGTGTSARSNARTLDWNGNETLAGGLTASGNVNVKDGNGNTKVSLNSSTGDISCTSVNGVTPTEVAANPSGTGSADLTKIQIGNSIYDIPQGGGGSGGHTIVDDEGTSLTQRTDLQFNGAYLEDDSTNDTTKVNIARQMTKAEFNQLSSDELKGFIEVTDEIITSGDYVNELLWDYVTDNSGEIPFGTYSVTLSRSIDAFDTIIVSVKSYSSDTGDWNNPVFIPIDVVACKTNPLHPNYFVITSFEERASVFYINGNTFSKIKDNDNFINTINGLIAVYGIKYGGNNHDYWWKDIEGTLTAGETTITLSDNLITVNSTIEIFTDGDVNYNSIVVSNGSIILTFDEQPTDLGVKVRIS